MHPSTTSEEAVMVCAAGVIDIRSCITYSVAMVVAAKTAEIEKITM
jgi:hypothetical protein